MLILSLSLTKSLLPFQLFHTFYYFYSSFLCPLFKITILKLFFSSSWDHLGYCSMVFFIDLCWFPYAKKYVNYFLNVCVILDTSILSSSTCLSFVIDLLLLCFTKCLSTISQVTMNCMENPCHGFLKFLSINLCIGFLLLL